MGIKLLVISSYDDALNAVRPEGELFIGLQRAGVDVSVMTQGDTEYARKFREAGIKVYDFHPQKKWDKQAVAFIRQILINGKYQILHLFNNKAIINGIRAAKGLPVRVVTYRGYTGNIHWYDPIVYFTHLNPRVDKITCLADSVREHIQKNMLFRSPDIAVTVNKGHDPAWYAAIQPADLSEFHFPPDALVVSCVANNRRMKGIPYLIAATHYLPGEAPIHFLIIGKGMEKFARQIEASPFRDRIHLAGFRRNALELVAACDISVLPSIKGEATPKAVLEAMYLGRPTILTSIGGNKGMAVDGESGLVVPPQKPKAIAEALIWMWQHPAARETMGKKGHLHISTHFTVERSVREMKAVYEALLQA